MQLHELQKTLRDMQREAVERDETVRSLRLRAQNAEQQAAFEREQAAAARTAAARQRQQQKEQMDAREGEGEEEERVRALSASAADLGKGDQVKSWSHHVRTPVNERLQTPIPPPSSSSLPRRRRRGE